MGPRALGHRSILANPCNPRARELLNERVKYREAIRPLAPMATLSAAKALFDLSEGGSDDEYNAYNYMVLTARAKPQARAQVPAVIHVDGTARLQIMREHTDAVTHAYLKALGRRIGVEIAVNTSFNVGGPIAQTPVQALDTLRRAKGMDGVFMFSEEGQVIAAWIREPAARAAARFPEWLAEWQNDANVAIELSGGAVGLKSVSSVSRFESYSRRLPRLRARIGLQMCTDLLPTGVNWSHLAHERRDGRAQRRQWHQSLFPARTANVISPSVM